MALRLLLMVCVTGGIVSVTSDQRHPNILFLMADDLRVQLGYNRQAPQQPFSIGPDMVTPHLDGLAARSLVLDRAYVQQSVCNPSRTSALTSRRPDTTKVYSSREHFRKTGGNFTTIPQYFKQHGYTTLGMGKIFHPKKEDPISWSETFYEAPNHKYYKSKKRGSMMAADLATRTLRPLPDDQVTGRAVDALRRLAPGAVSGHQPFFLAVGFHKPHLPWVFPAEMLDHYPIEDIQIPNNMYAPVNMPPVAWHSPDGVYAYKDIKVYKAGVEYNTSKPLPDHKVRDMRRAYYACVTYIDHLVGCILTELEAQGLANNTIVSFWGDHGWLLGEHGAWSKQSNFELANRVPFLVHIPGHTDAGLRTDRLVEMVDLFPTLVEAAGLPLLSTCNDPSTDETLCTEGMSLMPLVSDPVSSPWKNAAFSQFPRKKGVMGYSMKTEGYRYTEWVRMVKGQPVWRRQVGSELYDHSIDPEENVNRAMDDAYTQVRNQLSAKLHQGWRAAIP